MELYTLAERFYPELGGKVPIAFNPNEIFESMPGSEDRLKVVFIRKGTGILELDGKRVSVIAPAVLCFNEKETASLQEREGWEAESIYFHPRYVNEMLTFDKIRGLEKENLITGKQDIFLFRPFVFRDGNYLGQLNIDAASLNNICSLMASAKREIEEQSHNYWSCRARSYFLELLFALVTIYQTPGATVSSIIKKASPLADKVILYLNSNYGTKITISELCKKFNTNKTTLQDQFQEAAGQSVMTHLIALRVKLATLMLKDTGLSVTEISERLGFSDVAHMNKMFKKITGYSPIQYRKSFKSGFHTLENHNGELRHAE